MNRGFTGFIIVINSQKETTDIETWMWNPKVSQNKFNKKKVSPAKNRYNMRIQPNPKLNLNACGRNMNKNIMLWFESKMQETYWERYLIPLSTPVTTDTVAINVIIQIMTIWEFDVLGKSKTLSIPALIWVKVIVCHSQCVIERHQGIYLHYSETQRSSHCVMTTWHIEIVDKCVWIRQ